MNEGIVTTAVSETLSDQSKVWNVLIHQDEVGATPICVECVNEAAALSLASKLPELFRRAGLGATGAFPEGKDFSEDQGELRFAVGHDRDNVIFDFGKEVSWIAFPPAYARLLARALLQHAQECER